MKYSQQGAEIYRDLGLSGTYGFFMPLAVELLQPLSSKHVLDFGCGAGRGSQMLKLAGADTVLGVDRDLDMLQQAQSASMADIEFQKINSLTELEAKTYDACFCANVIPETSTLDELKTIFSAIHQALKPGAPAVFTATNPLALGHDFVSFRLLKPASTVPGAPTACEVINNGKKLTIEDHYWPAQTLKAEIEAAGFTINRWDTPLAVGEGWKSETEIAPEILIKVTAGNT
ncbi:MAG: class I SAM-dependent methyltransferase [Gammaproteobacteria bacterium]|nr:class I SAM-dependent methyltransferase [Gammaproteobacteria bacterium]